MLRTTTKTIEPTILDFSPLEAGVSSESKGKYYQIKPNQLNKSWRTSALLQTTLDLKSMIVMFSREVNNTVTHSGIMYQHAESHTELKLGRSTKKSYSFELLVEKQNLGEITFMSGKSFTQKQRTQLEFLLVSLVYPLRNALQYLSAYQASTTDPLTGKNNRLILNSTLKHEIGLFHRYNTPLTLLIMDVDHFKKINDVHGHECGDKVIQVIADTIAECVRETDTLVRYGGDEFVVLLSNTTSQGGHRISEHIRDTLANIQLEYNGKNIHFTASIGGASLTDSDIGNSLFTRADEALLLAKKCGRNCSRLP
jgi:diguanylate cyclase (GGDEF)-like protein